MSIPSFSEWPDIPQRSAPEADFDAKMYALFQHFATTHRNEMLAFINFLESNSTVINGALNGTSIGLNTPAAGKFTTLEADILGIGTSSPVAALDVRGGSVAIAPNSASSWFTAIAGLSLITNDATNNKSTPLIAMHSDRSDRYATINSVRGTASGYIGLAFDVSGNAAPSEAMRIEPDGRVGIGTTSPARRLDVLENVAGTAAHIEAGSGNSTNNHALGVTHNGASFTNDVVRIIAAKPANSDYSLFTARSGGGADIEFLLTGDGLGKSDRGWEGTGADYAEYFEWLDDNPDAETRTGLSVVLDGDKIRPAQDGETPIGVISANPSVVGDGDIDRWKGKYLRDDFGAYIWEDYEAVSWTETVTETETVQEQATEAQERTREVIEVANGQAVKKIVTETVQVPLFDEFPLVDEAGNDLGTYRVPRMVEVVRETTKDVGHSYAADEVPEGVTVPVDAERVTQKRRKLNPDYDPSQPYIPRAERPEWDLVGLMGKLRIRKGQPVAPSWIKMRDVSAEVEEWLAK